MTTKLSRRDFLRILKIIFLSMFSSGPIMAIYSLFGEPTWLDVEQVEIILPRLPKSFSGLRILHISDIHIGGWMNRTRLSDVIELAKRQKPDLVVMTGDYVIGSSWTENLDDAALDFIEEVSKLTADYLVLGVLGNHDHWTDAGKVRAMLSKCGVVELNNGVYSLRRGEDRLHIAGVDDVREHKARLGDVCNLLPESGGAILLAHEPDFADMSSQKDIFDLQLSGHSHGGQVVIPFYGPLVLPYLGRKYPSGLYKVGNMWQYTTRGVGMTEPAVRFNCRPEITVLTLR
jgi:predicted MPP superfamily phosphohydrolase